MVKSKKMKIITDAGWIKTERPLGDKSLPGTAGR